MASYGGVLVGTFVASWLRCGGCKSVAILAMGPFCPLLACITKLLSLEVNFDKSGATSVKRNWLFLIRASYSILLTPGLLFHCWRP